MRTWRISLATSILITILLVMASACSLERTDQVEESSAAVTGALLQYEGAYILVSPNVRVLFWRTGTGLTVTDPTKAIAAPMVRAVVSTSYYDWLKAEYTTPAALSPTGVSLVPFNGAFQDQIESTNGLADVITDSDIRAQIKLELGNGRLGSHNGNESTDTQLLVLVVVPAGVSVQGLSSSASNSDVPYHDIIFQSAGSVPYIVVRDDAGFTANGSAGLVSAALNPDADFNFRAWQSGFRSVPFREVGCFGVGASVPVRDFSSGTIAVAPAYSNAQGACIGPPLQITDASANPVPPSQTQSVASGARPRPYTFFTTNRSVATVGLSSNAACVFSPSTLPAGAVARVDCNAPDQNVTLAATFGSTVYHTNMHLSVRCPLHQEFDGTTCVPPPCDCD